MLNTTTHTIKLLLSISLIIALLTGCKKEDEAMPIPEFPKLLDESRIQETIGVADTITLYFNDFFTGFEEYYQVESKYYLLDLVSISFDDMAIDTAQNMTDNSIDLWVNELLTPNTTYNVSVTLEWTLNRTAHQVTEEIAIRTDEKGFPVENILASYPIDRQYYFLQGEYANGFLYLDKLPASADDYTVTVFDVDGNELSTSTVVKNSDHSRLDFDLPSLANEEIYHLSFQEKGEVLFAIDFRTSKYDRFEDKIANMSPGNTVNRGLHIPWSQHFLIQQASILEEGFDKAEVRTATEAIEGQGYNYCDGLIMLEFNPTDNAWYDEFLYPVVYAPFPDEDFEPKYAFHPNLGDQLFRAMHFSLPESLIELTDGEIDSGIATQDATGTLDVLFYVQSAAYYDFKTLQESVVDEYINDATMDERVELVVWGQYQVLRTGTYKYDAKYRLPDGTITSSVTYEMVYN